MIFSENWVRQWIKLKLDTAALVECLTMAGLEVDSVAPAGPALEQVVVGRITGVTPHPQAVNLQVCAVMLGGRKSLDIVCGAPNARVGLNAPVALPGAILPAGRMIDSRAIRGVMSNGMLCSAQELNLGDEAGGLLEFDADARPGQTVHEYLDLGDKIITIDLTPNRGDCLSIVGIARELAVLTGGRLKQAELPGWPDEGEAHIAIAIDSPEHCPRYVGRVIKGINRAGRTPCWMRERLRRCGIRPINPVVDVTNYVMLEIGQPMHAFDLDCLNQRIIVRQAEPGEALDLLDGSSQTLRADTLVIADDAGAIALAGIMGGSTSAISAQTDSIVLEAAFFSPTTQAGQARHYGLHTDSSHRFERGVDPELPTIASGYATSLLKGIVGGTPGPMVEAVHPGCLPKRRPVEVRRVRIDKLLGIRLPKPRINKILSRVGAQVQFADATWLVTPPSYRFDIDIECDLIEELARVHGYDKFPAATPRLDLRQLASEEATLNPVRLKQALVDRGFHEAITYSFVDPQIQDRLYPESASITLQNPLAPAQSVMRISLWPGLLQVLSTNLNRQHRRVRLFEVGKTFHPENGETREIERLSGIVSGSPWPEQWGAKARDADFYDVKSDVEALFTLTGVPETFSFHPVERPGLHPGQSSEIQLNGKSVGSMGQLHPELQRYFDISQSVFLFELDLAAIKYRKMPNYIGISKFPAIRRDLAVVVDEGIPARNLLNSIQNTVGENLTNLELFDVYRREGIDSKRKSLAFSLTLQSYSRTLIDSEVDMIIDRVLNELRDKYGAELRT